MKKKNLMTWALVLGMGGAISSCGIDMPKEVQSSFETMTVEKQDIEVPIKFSAKLKGQADVTISSNMYKGAQAVIALYIALGGGTK